MAKKNVVDQPTLPNVPAPTIATPENTTVKLSQAEENALLRLRPDMRIEARADMMASKLAEKITYLNSPETQARLARDAKNRSEFNVQQYKSKAVGVTGLGRKFPVALYKSEWRILLDHAEEIEAFLVNVPDEE